MLNFYIKYDANLFVQTKTWQQTKLSLHFIAVPFLYLYQRSRIHFNVSLTIVLVLHESSNQENKKSYYTIGNSQFIARL